MIAQHYIGMNNKVIIIDYDLGNIGSVANALKKLAIPFEISSDPQVLNNAQAFILPGVGAAGKGMKNLKARKLDGIIREKVKNGTPILGICLGMQLLLSFSEEGNVTCLNIVEGKVKKFDPIVKVPQIGWNQVKNKNNTVLLKGIKNNSYFYFANSYYCKPENEDILKGETEYGRSFCSVLEKGTIYAAQFHPEKSGDAGLQFLKNFWEAVW